MRGESFPARKQWRCATPFLLYGQRLACPPSIMFHPNFEILEQAIHTAHGVPWTVMHGAVRTVNAPHS